MRGFSSGKKIGTGSGPSRISPQFEDLTLLDILRNIQEGTGILFSIDSSLETVPFSVSIQANDWEDAVSKLLIGFSRVEVWTDNLSTSRIWLLSGGRNVEVALAKPSRKTKHQTTRQEKPATRPKTRFRSIPPPVPASSVKFKVKMEDLPPHILFEPGVLSFFKSKGMKMPDNVKNIFGPNLEGLPTNMPISRHILSHPTFKNFLDSKGIQAPKA